MTERISGLTKEESEKLEKEACKELYDELMRMEKSGALQEYFKLIENET